VTRYQTTQNSRSEEERMIPVQRGFLGSGQPNGLPPKPDLNRYQQTTKPTESKPVEQKPIVRTKRKRGASDTQRERILEVLRELKIPVYPEDVAIECWRRWPEQFSMRKYPEHPCTNKVYAKLATLTTEGLVHRPSVGMVQITPKGKS